MEQPAPTIELIDADISKVGARLAGPSLQGVSWQIGKGDFWAVGAPPGSGKTDLLSTTAVLQRPVKGYQLVFGKDAGQMNEEELVLIHQKVGMVFEGGRLFPNLSVAANLELPLAYHSGTPRKSISTKVKEVLEMTGLSAVRESLPAQITRNLHQRVGLARALALEPEVLVIDGPLQGIDPRQRRWWLDFLCQLNHGHPFFDKRPITLIVSADDFRPWSDIAREFAVIKEGGLHVVGNRSELKKTRESMVHELLRPAFDSD